MGCRISCEKIACVTRVSVRFWSKERRGTGFSVLTEREMKGEPKNERGGGEGRNFPHPLPALLLAPFVARSLTPVPRSLLLDRKEKLATQASEKRIKRLLLKKDFSYWHRKKFKKYFIWKIYRAILFSHSNLI